MLVSFSVSNFRSFAEEQTFSMVASNRFDGHTDHLTPIPGTEEKALRLGIVYGANASGKSNFFKALAYVQRVARETRKKNTGTGREFFRLGNLEGDISEFDVQFVANNQLYRFGFKVNDQSILEEWLIRINGTRESIVYERMTDSQGTVTIDIRNITTPNEKLKALATIGAPSGQSFLATIWNSPLEMQDVGKEIEAVLFWFIYQLKLIAPDASFGPLANFMNQNEECLSFSSSFLNAASTGIHRITADKKEVAFEDVCRDYGEDDVKQFQDELEDNGSVVLPSIEEGLDILMEKKDGKDSFFKFTLQAGHLKQDGQEVAMRFTEESDGTRRLLHLMPALHFLKSTPCVFVVDEIDRSMHPVLSKKFLEFFIKSGTTSQLIVTTHESNLLDQELVRRDEVWFAEKNQAEATHLYSLSDFKVRKDLEIRKGYLQGRFGAIPFLGKIDQLLPERPE